MEMTIINSVLSLGGVGLLLGLGLGLASKKLAVEEDPRLAYLVAVLPGANCGGCGVAGCAAFARGLLNGSTKPNGCPVGGADCTAKISDILGIEAVLGEKQVAYIRCNGDDDVTRSNYEYYGLLDCTAATHLVGGGSKACTFACLGGGNCVSACQFNAINIVNGIAVVDKEKCTSCGACVPSCPKALIDLIPYKSIVTVACNSKAPGKIVRQNCSVGCISCKLCEKACEYDAIHVVDNIAKVDYAKCTYCNECVKKCPSATINSTTFENPKKQKPQEKKVAENAAASPQTTDSPAKKQTPPEPQTEALKKEGTEGKKVE
ncbi:MAG: RnfABCDGE type electron transport complex subunit B [Defluviitaleaceae bacterium]|nr:RnfABCDGE type electron transport complex subunit B [Defluviitaleaceae bacterium]